MSYGKPRSSDPSEVTRLSVDANGFKIPSQIKQSFRLKTFSDGDPRSQKGEFVGGVPTPTLPLKKDNMIMKDSRLNNNGPKNTGPSSLGPQPNVVNSMQLDWNTNAPFHLAVEPWITSPLMTPTDDGLYIGNLKGEQLNIGKTNLTLQVKLNTDYPESVVALIKNGKAMIFKTAQLVATTGSKVFSDVSIYDKSFANPGVNTKGNYTFETKPSDKKLEMQAVIGTLVMSSAFIHLFHLCTQDYAIHMALEEYYRNMPKKVDDLAETFLSNVPNANFQICVVPTSMDPAEYLENLRQFLVNFQGAKLVNEPLYSSLLDDIIKLISTTMYKIRRLYSGGKIFSDITDYPNKFYAEAYRDGIYDTSKSRNMIPIIQTKEGEYYEYLDPKANYNYKDVRNILISSGINMLDGMIRSRLRR